MVRRRSLCCSGAPLLAAALCAGVGHAEGYTVTATNALAVDREGRLLQSWSVACLAENPDADAVVSLSGKDLRFFVANEEPLQVGVDAVTHAVGEVAGRYEYDVVAGARVVARFAARCGTDDVFDTVSVDSAPVTLAPALAGPERVQATEDFSDVPAERLVVGQAVELVGLRVEGAPRGSEEITVTIQGAGVDTRLTLGPSDFSDGFALVAPQIVPSLPGTVEVKAELLGVVSAPVLLEVVADQGPTEEPLSDDTVDANAGCTATGGSPWVLGLTGLVGGLWRRRRHPRG